jgi:hypothetical protein
MATAAWAANHSSVLSSSSVKAPESLLTASSTPMVRSRAMSGTPRIERVLKWISMSTSACQRGSLRTSATSSGWPLLTTQPPMLPSSGTAICSRSEAAIWVDARKCSSPVRGSTSMIDTPSLSVSSRAAATMRFSSLFRSRVEVSVRVISIRRSMRRRSSG